MKWYQKTWVIVLLLVFFFPAGVFLMWKEKQSWKKPVKIVLSTIMGIWFLGSVGAVFSEPKTENVASSKGKITESKTVKKEESSKTVEKKASIKLQETSLTLKDNEEKEVKFSLENIKQEEVKAIIKDGSIASSELKDGVCIIKGVGKGSTVLQLNSKDNITLAELKVSVEESEETIAKRQAEEKAEQERKAQEEAAAAEAERVAQEKAEQERIAAEQAEQQRIAQEQAAQAEAERQAQEQAAQANVKDYVLNTNTKKFHYPSCRDVSRIKAENYSTMSGTRDDAINSGYSPCGHCNP